MNDQERYEDAVRRLAQYGYRVLSDDQGYIVESLTDPNDVSRAHDIDQLVELADLVEWRENRRRSTSSVESNNPLRDEG